MRKLALFGLSGLYSVFLLAHCVGDEAATTGGTTPEGGGGGSETSTTDKDSSTTDNDSGVITDSSVADTSPVDAGPPCDVTKPFGLVKPLTGDVNSGADETYGRMLDNGLELYFNRGKKIFRATRAAVTDPWGGSAEVTVLNQKPGGAAAEALSPTLTGDGKTMFMQLYDGVEASYANLYMSTRPATGAANWAAPTIVTGPGFSTTGPDDAPFVTRNGLRIYFYRTSPYHTVFIERSAVGMPWSAPTLAFTGTTEEPNTVVSDNELSAFFAVYAPPPGGGTNQRRTYVATRTSTILPFSNPTYVTELNLDDKYTEPNWVSKDGCTIIVHSNRVGAGGFDLFTATRPK